MHFQEFLNWLQKAAGVPVVCVCVCGGVGGVELVRLSEEGIVSNGNISSQDDEVHFK